jgi:hypothetical protein
MDTLNTLTSTNITIVYPEPKQLTFQESINQEVYKFLLSGKSKKFKLKTWNFLLLYMWTIK